MSDDSNYFVNERVIDTKIESSDYWYAIRNFMTFLGYIIKDITHFELMVSTKPQQQQNTDYMNYTK